MLQTRIFMFFKSEMHIKLNYVRLIPALLQFHKNFCVTFVTLPHIFIFVAKLDYLGDYYVVRLS